MQSRPSAIWHMMSWGVGSGSILAMSYIAILFDFFSAGGDTNALLLLFNPFTWFLALIFGAVPGAVMGFFLGLNLRGMLLHVPLPFTKVDMNEKRLNVYGWTFTLTLFLSFLLIFFFFGSLFNILLLGIPPFIAAIASTYAAHRYMFQLRLWSGGAASRKSKAKNEALSATHLIEKNTEQDDMPYSDSISAEKQDYLP